jgi:hypothetical protein
MEEWEYERAGLPDVSDWTVKSIHYMQATTMTELCKEAALRKVPLPPNGPWSDMDPFNPSTDGDDPPAARLATPSPSTNGEDQLNARSSTSSPVTDGEDQPSVSGRSSTSLSPTDWGHPLYGSPSTDGENPFNARLSTSSLSTDGEDQSNVSPSTDGEAGG